ncbi:hypothetical protein L873DRAFT_1512454 [Choiromyces venosus 120613-1]|uniref:Uncharacterized protein n=1 Tax=Choiromyces venosus 120613-1 TaxID=1336337 RepID=A0A3N4J5V3_9PEZI|nr:hypothetical protein L873DRAFT_1512454 [Choiromyces venosus 120613-1]
MLTPGKPNSTMRENTQHSLSLSLPNWIHDTDIWPPILILQSNQPTSIMVTSATKKPKSDVC